MSDPILVEKLMHYSDRTVALERRRYEQGEPHSFAKPAGFWVSVQGEDDWPSWCEGEEIFLDSLTQVHEVALADGANILRINTGDELLSFTEQHAVQTEWERRFDWKRNNKRQWPIDWREVAPLYDGIIIAPYQWQHRSSVDWYYGWDCASGCIWNLEAIASVTLIAAGVPCATVSLMFELRVSHRRFANRLSRDCPFLWQPSCPSGHGPTNASNTRRWTTLVRSRPSTLRATW